ncbi:MAG TPA: 50S ribosomal protein L9 [Candidatus Paceibacterota bacterium]|nr:50S ribosomal protein L9 [Candidatus Paceibacterota bacterium]
MKVVLLKDIKGVGKKNDVKTIADGYALNFLIPQNLAEVATAQALKNVELKKSQELAEKKIKEDLIVKNLKSIHDTRVEIEVNANEQGHLYDGLSKQDIATKVHESSRIDLLPECIELEKPIKTTGEHMIDIKVQGKTARFTLVVKGKK